MPDVFDSQKRSEVMRLIKSKNTKVELIVFRYLRQEKVYFQKYYKRAPGTPDIALPRKKRAVFIDGDFWHGKTLDAVILRRGQDDYWTKKIQRNMERDREQLEQLVNAGWKVLRVWEADILRKRTQTEGLEKIKEFLLS
ncbi:MAG: very short patch repair endonuclease [Candidatus Saccharimonadales bacterium]